ncbi:MAG TPA: M50 family metallopeptidase, partial [Pyrinomonadaceae bacterium]|nr:M50 family metallopeptidase [Pyrinomonadaceae bacterium]
LAVQCVLNALFDLKTVFFLSSPLNGMTVHTDAQNMAQFTGIPAIFWTVAWIAIALGILWFAMRLYVARRESSYQPDLPFEETSTV